MKCNLCIVSPTESDNIEFDSYSELVEFVDKNVTDPNMLLHIKALHNFNPDINPNCNSVTVKCQNNKLEFIIN